MLHMFSNHIFPDRIRIKRGQYFCFRKARLDTHGLVGRRDSVVVGKRVVFSVGLFVV